MALNENQPFQTVYGGDGQYMYLQGGVYYAADKTTVSSADAVHGTSKEPVYGVTDPITGRIRNFVGGTEAEPTFAASNLPLYVDMIGRFGQAGVGAPSGIANYPVAGTTSLSITGFAVTGARGESTITLNSGTIAHITGQWAGVIQYDDGQWYAHTIRNATAGHIDVSPPLLGTVTKGAIVNLHDSAQDAGFHYTEAGYFALIDHMLRTPANLCVRDAYYGRILATNPAGWFCYGGQNPANLVAGTAQIYGDTSAGATDIRALDTNTIGLNPLTQTGAGIEKDFAVDPQIGGWLEASVCCDSASSVRVDVRLDYRLVYSKVVIGLEKINVPFFGVSSVLMRVQSVSGAPWASVGTATAWKGRAWGQNAIIPDNSRVAWLGDSWGEYFSAATSRRITDRLSDHGVTCIPRGLGGVTSQWAIDNFAPVASARPDVVVIEYFINDFWAVNDQNNYAGWVSRIATLVSMVQAIGAKPVVMLPPITVNVGLTNVAARWSNILIGQ